MVMIVSKKRWIKTFDGEVVEAGPETSGTLLLAEGQEISDEQAKELGIPLGEEEDTEKEDGSEKEEDSEDDADESDEDSDESENEESDEDESDDSVTKKKATKKPWGKKKKAKPLSL